MLPKDLRFFDIWVRFEPRDIWVGIYWNFSRSVESNYKRLDVYICILPMLPFHFELAWNWKYNQRSS